MTKIECDRCGADATNDPATADLLRGRRTDEEREIIEEADLCHECTLSLMVWLRIAPTEDRP